MKYRNCEENGLYWIEYKAKWWHGWSVLPGSCSFNAHNRDLMRKYLNI